MKLCALKELVALLEERFDYDTEIRFSDYSRRTFPELDLDRKVSEIDLNDHICPNGVVRLPLDTPHT